VSAGNGGNEKAMRRRYERNVSRFRPGQGWASGSSCYRILEGPINKPMYVLRDEDDEAAGYEPIDRLALRTRRLPDNEAAADLWLDESVFPYLRLMHDPERTVA
jgi:hypothetical protein